MDCCAINGLGREFNEAFARKELKAYLKKGQDKRARKLADFLKTQDLSGATLLDIGCGIGALHLELLKGGARKAVGVDVSSANVQAATTLAQKLSLENAVEYRVGDFVELEEDIPPAHIVLLDRVICCYPDMKALVAASARHAERLCALTYPRWAWWIRAGIVVGNFVYAILRRRFRAFAHRPEEVAEILAAHGFTRVFQTSSGFWEIVVYQRA